MRQPAPKLVVVTDLGVADETRTLAVVATVLDAIDPTLVVIGVRDHVVPVRRKIELGKSLVAMARPRGARVLVHDRIDVALAIEADGVQLGARSVDVTDARKLLPRDAIVAKSCHDATELSRAMDDAVDWVTLSPLFASPGKGAPLGEEAFARLRAGAKSLAVIALGGVDASNAARAKSCGADGVAAIRAILSATDAEIADIARRMIAPFVDGRSVARSNASSTATARTR